MMGKRIWFLLLVLLLVLAGYTVGYTVQVIKPAVDAVAQLKVRSIVSQNVNDAILEKFAEEFDLEGLVQVTSDENGRVAAVKADTAALNRLATDLSFRIQKRLAEMEEERVEVPIGAVLGSSILSQVGPSFHLRIVPLGTAKVNYKTEFEAAGINQTKHTIYLQVDSTAKVLAPFSMENVTTHNKVLVAEILIVGDVPQSYIFVPEEDLLDVVD